MAPWPRLYDRVGILRLFAAGFKMTRPRKFPLLSPWQLRVVVARLSAAGFFAEGIAPEIFLLEKLVPGET